jgi:ribose 5-phosphate isomerase B
MRVHVGSDHAGYELKQHILTRLTQLDYEAVDQGPAEYDADDDYPPFCLRVGEAVVAEPGSLGIVIGGSGNGEQIAANKVHGVRAALAWSEETARLAREHNNAQVVSVGARMHNHHEALAIIEVFLTTEFSENPRHARRIDMLADYERTGTLPPTS